MRQSGIIAAAALYALENHRERLAEDHENAKTLAFGLAEIPGIKLDPNDVETNIIFFWLEEMDAYEFAEILGKRSILVEAVEMDLIRAVTNMMIGSSDIPNLLSVIQKVMSSD